MAQLEYLYGGFQKGAELALSVLPCESITATANPWLFRVSAWFLSKTTSEAQKFIFDSLESQVDFNIFKPSLRDCYKKCNTYCIRSLNSRLFNKVIQPSADSWPLFLRAMPTESYKEFYINRIFSNYRTPSEFQNLAWDMMDNYIGTINELNYVRLTARNEIELIAGDRFDRVLAGSDSINMFLANKDCLKKNAAAEIATYNSNKFIKNFIDFNKEIKNKIYPEDKFYTRFINNLMSTLEAMAILRSRQKEYRDKLHFYLYNGVNNQGSLPTLRGTLIETGEIEKAMVMFMPERAPGMCSSPVEIDDNFNDIHKEIDLLRPEEMQNLQGTLLEYGDYIMDECKDYGQITSNSLEIIKYGIKTIINNQNLPSKHIISTVEVMRKELTAIV